MNRRLIALFLPLFLIEFGIGVATGVWLERNSLVYDRPRPALAPIDVVNSPPITVSAIGLVDPVYLDWDKLPDKFIYVTVDKSHFVAAWTSRPSAYGTRWYNDEDGEGVDALPYIHTVGIGHPGDWRKNIWRRPR